MDLGVIIRDPDDGTISFSFGASPRRLSGVGQLLQNLVVELMTDPRPEFGRGSGFVRLLRTTLPDDVAVLRARAEQALDTARQHILQNQANDPGLTDSERLNEVQLLDLTTDGQRWFADLSLRAVSGSRFVFTAA